MNGSNVRKISIVALVILMSMLIVLGQSDEVDAAAKISNKKATLIVGQKLRLKVTGTNKKVKWSSSKKSVAKVSSKGKVKAIKKGTAVIKAKVGKKVLKCKIKVEKPVLNKEQEWITVGADSKLKLKDNTQNVEWKSSNTKVVTVSKGKIRAMAEGKATVKAVVGKKTYSCVVYVSDKDMKEAVDNIKGVVKIVNKERKNRNLSELELDYNLCLAAIERCKELKTNFSHTRPNGEKCYSILNDYGFKMYSLRGENIAYGYTTPKMVMEGWMNSDGHRGQILEPKYKKIGVGFYFDEESEICYWSQFFYTL